MIRQVRGGSQAVLVRADDDRLYILKFSNNPQGPNVLANEFLASRLARSVGLPVAETVFLTVTKSFLTENPLLTLETREHRYPPEPGIHLGSTFIEDVDPHHRSTEWLRPCDIRRISNLSDFLGMYLFDVWAMQVDNRQAIFTPDPHAKMLRATFIDNGHLFGGPDWKHTPRRFAPCHRDRYLYSGLWDKGAVRSWTKKLKDHLPSGLLSATALIPADWHAGDLSGLTEALLLRLATLPILFAEHSLEQSPLYSAGLKSELPLRARLSNL